MSYRFQAAAGWWPLFLVGVGVLSAGMARAQAPIVVADGSVVIKSDRPFGKWRSGGGGALGYPKRDLVIGRVLVYKGPDDGSGGRFEECGQRACSVKFELTDGSRIEVGGLQKEGRGVWITLGRFAPARDAMKKESVIRFGGDDLLIQNATLAIEGAPQVTPLCDIRRDGRHKCAIGFELRK